MNLYLAQVTDSKKNTWFNLVKAESKDGAHYKVLQHHREKYNIECEVFITEVIE
jgi:hypothetical protein